MGPVHEVSVMMAPRGASDDRLSQRKRWKDADARQRRDMIIDQAIRLLARHGVQGLTVRRVAQRLGVGAMTLYTYVKGQEDLHREITRRGFEMLSAQCKAASTLGTAMRWRGGARCYLQFALENPRLYELMFATPLANADAMIEVHLSGFQPLWDRVRERLEELNLSGPNPEQAARIAAGRYWIALHGLAMLAIAGRLHVLGADAESLLEDLIEHVAPDAQLAVAKDAASPSPDLGKGRVSDNGSDSGGGASGG